VETAGTTESAQIYYLNDSTAAKGTAKSKAATTSESTETSKAAATSAVTAPVTTSKRLVGIGTISGQYVYVLMHAAQHVHDQ
jgi:hypothetical protein